MQTIKYETNLLIHRIRFNQERKRREKRRKHTQERKEQQQENRRGGGGERNKTKRQILKRFCFREEHRPLLQYFYDCYSLETSFVVAVE